MPIAIIIAVIYYAIAQRQWQWQLRYLQDTLCVRHSSSAGSPPFGGIIKQLKCHWENKFPAEISATSSWEDLPRNSIAAVPCRFMMDNCSGNN